MTVTKNQDKRIEILDELLKQKRSTQELLDRLNEKNDGKFIDKRTLYRDINNLIDKKAPIHRPEKGDPYYYYSERFSIKNTLLDEDDISSLKKAVEILRQVEDFQLLKEVEGIVARLENKIHTKVSEQPTIVQFEKHTSSLGHDYVEELFEAIQTKSPLRISYQPFTKQAPEEKNVHPYLLKEFRNRWFLFGRFETEKRLSIYALDRIKRIKNSNLDFIENDLFNPVEYFKYLIGVSVPPDALPQKIELKIYKDSTPYVLSKPIHNNQKVIKKNKDGSVIIRMELIINYELRSMLLSYGPGIEIKKPLSLRRDMKSLARDSLNRY